MIFQGLNILPGSQEWILAVCESTMPRVKINDIVPYRFCGNVELMEQDNTFYFGTIYFGIPVMPLNRRSSAVVASFDSDMTELGVTILVSDGTTTIERDGLFYQGFFLYASSFNDTDNNTFNAEFWGWKITYDNVPAPQNSSNPTLSTFTGKMTDLGWWLLASSDFASTRAIYYVPTYTGNADRVKIRYPDGSIFESDVVASDVPKITGVYDASVSRLLDFYCSNAAGNVSNIIQANLPTDYYDHINVTYYGYTETGGDRKITCLMNWDDDYSADTFLVVDNAGVPIAGSSVIVDDENGSFVASVPDTTTEAWIKYNLLYKGVANPSTINPLQLIV